MSEIPDLKQLPAVLRNEIKEYVYGPVGYVEHKYKMGAVMRSLKCYEDFDPNEFTPSSVRVDEAKEVAGIKKKYPSLWNLPGFRTHETYMRPIVFKLDRDAYAVAVKAISEWNSMMKVVIEALAHKKS